MTPGMGTETGVLDSGGGFYDNDSVGSNTVAMSIVFPLLALLCCCAVACALYYGHPWYWDPKWSPSSVATNPHKVDVKPCSQVSEAWQPDDCKEKVEPAEPISEPVPETPVKVLSELQVNVAIAEGLRLRDFDEVDYIEEPETPAKTQMIPGSQVIVTLPPAQSPLRGATCWEVQGDQARLFCKPPQR